MGKRGGVEDEERCGKVAGGEAQKTRTARPRKYGMLAGTARPRKYGMMAGAARPRKYGMLAGIARPRKYGMRVLENTGCESHKIRDAGWGCES